MTKLSLKALICHRNCSKRKTKTKDALYLKNDNQIHRRRARVCKSRCHSMPAVTIHYFVDGCLFVCPSIHKSICLYAC